MNGLKRTVLLLLLLSLLLSSAYSDPLCLNEDQQTELESLLQKRQIINEQLEKKSVELELKLIEAQLQQEELKSESNQLRRRLMESIVLLKMDIAGLKRELWTVLKQYERAKESQEISADLQQKAEQSTKELAKSYETQQRRQKWGSRVAWLIVLIETGLLIWSLLL